MTPRREAFAVRVTVALGAAVVAFVSVQTWASLRPRFVVSAVHVTPLSVSGGMLSPGLTSLGLVGIAGSGLLFTVRGRWRVVVALVLAAMGVAAAALAVHGRSSAAALRSALAADHVAPSEYFPPVWNAWWVVAVVGAGVMTAAALVAVVRLPSWPSAGDKYDAPTAPRRARDPAAAAWDALDRGDDPTV